MKKKNIDSNQRLLITQQEMVLIKNSDEATNVDLYGNLFDCIQDYKKLSKSNLDNNMAFCQKAKTVLTNPDNRKVMMGKIKSEWYSYKNCDIVDTLVNCQLCGRPNRYVYYIHNKITNVDLHIGSDCVRNFTDITGIKQQKKRLSQLKKEQEQQKRKIDFEVLEGDDSCFIEDAENKFNNFPILLPYKIFNDLKDRISQIALLKSAYIKNGGDLDETFSSYCNLKNIIRELFISAEHYHNSVSGNPLICDKNTAEWLLKNNKNIWEMVSKNGGIFCADTLKKVRDERYVSQKIMLILRHMRDKDLQLLQVSRLYIHFSIKNERYVYPVTFTVPISYFMEHIGCYALTDKKYTFNKESLSHVAIENTSNNFHALYNSVFDTLKQNGYDFIIEEKTAQAYWKKLSQLDRKSQWSNRVISSNPMYKRSSTTTFFTALSPFLLKDENYMDNNFSEIIKIMERGQAWITQKEKNDREEAAKYARGIQKQKEFIPY